MKPLLPALMLVTLLAAACSQPAAAPPAQTKPVESGAAGQTLEQRLYEGAKKEGKFVWWYTSPAEEADKFIKAFQAKYPEIQIEYDDATAGAHLERYLLEIQAKKVSVDGVNVDFYPPVRKVDGAADLTELLDEAKVSANATTPDKKVLYMTHTVDGVGYNKNLLPAADVPKTWDDLLDPKYKGKLTVESRLTAFIKWTDVPEYEGQRPGMWSEQKVVDYLTRLKAQSPRVMDSNTSMATVLAAGEVPIIIGVHMQSFRRPQDKGAPIEWAPLDSNIVDSSTHFIAKDAPHPNAARLFYLWSLSPEGQKVWDDVRGQGDPTPGSGTTQAKYLYDRNIKPFFTTDAYQEHADDLAKKYRNALGLPS